MREAAELTRHRRRLAEDKSHVSSSPIPVKTSYPPQASGHHHTRRLLEGARHGVACQVGTHKPPQIPAKTQGQGVTPRLPGAGLTVE